MAQKPLAVKRVTQDEVDENSLARPTAYGWNFPAEVFDGEWWGLEIPNTKIDSAINSFRNQCQSGYGTRASTRKGANGLLYVRRLVNAPYSGPPSRKGRSE